jgi:DNA invertase Pin-like site-specific DNA recombinase
MIAVYARQSLDKKDSISIETQIDHCKREADTDNVKVFQDKGFSGKNIDRPAFAALMKAVENNEVEKIIVYRLDRISRSITDFSNIMNVLEECKVAFVSTTEKFDTSAPMGRAMLYIIMIFAQLERETIAERVKDNYYARGKTGVWLGGPAPLGFDTTKTILNGKQASTIKPNKDINLIQEIYDTYANTTQSLGTIAKTMLSRYNVMWNNIKLSRILHNPSYVKADADIYNYYRTKNVIIINPIEEFTGEKGLCLYGKRDRGANKYNSEELQVLSLSIHDGIIDSQTFLKCQRKLNSNRQIKNTGKGKHSWLTGLIKCGYCGYAMNVKAWKENKYFNCTGRYATNLCIDKLDTNYVDDIENYVFKSMQVFVEKFENKEINTDMIFNDTELNSFKIELSIIEDKISKLLDTIDQANSTLINYINSKIVELDNRKKEVLEKINSKSIKQEIFKVPNLTEWESMDIKTKGDIARMMLDKVLVRNGDIETVWKY